MYCTHYHVEGLLCQRLAGDQHNIETVLELWVKRAHDFAQPSPDTITRHRAAGSLADDKPIPIVRQIVRQTAYEQQAVVVSDACLPQASEILSPAQP